MNRYAVPACLAWMAATLTASAQPPAVVFPPDEGPGIQIAFNNVTENNPVDGWGTSPSSSGWSYDASAGSSIPDNENKAFLRMTPSYQGTGVKTQMLESADWVFHTEISQGGGYPASGSDFALFGKYDWDGAREDRMFALSWGNTDSSWALKVGNAGGGWDDVATGLTLTIGATVDLDIHYKAAPGEMDFYWDGSLVGTAATGHGRYDLDFIQVEEMGDASGLWTTYRNFRLAHVQSTGLTPVTEPQTVALPFQSTAQALYRLESSTDPAGAAWTSPGHIVRGDGNQRVAYDPDASSSTKNYRLVILPSPTPLETPVMVDFPTPVGPGIQLPFNNVSQEFPVDYGKKITSYGWSFTSWAGESIGSADSLLRIAPTLTNDQTVVTGMQEDVDWVFHAEYLHTEPYPAGSDFVMFAKYEVFPGDGREDRMFGLQHGADANSWSYRVGDASGGWDTVASGLTMSETVDIDIHYRAATKELDFYWDGVFVGSGETGHGRYDVTFIQFDDIPGEGSDVWRNFRLGHVNSPPGAFVELGRPVVAPADLFTFLTNSGLLYRMEGNADPISLPWTPLGLTIEGDGTQKYAFDPGGVISTSTSYRVRVVP